MIPVSKALKLIQQNVVPLGTETVLIGDVVGRILAEDVIADMDLPPFDRSQMDGFAVRSEDIAKAPVELKIVGESAAGNGFHFDLKAGQAVRIMTGARVPIGADTVQKVELTSEANFRSEAAERTDGLVTILESIAAGKNIVRRGEEVHKGDRILSAGDRINDRMVSVMAAFGYATVKVGRQPKVSILTTGTEVVEIDQTPGIDQIRNSNSAMLDALVSKAGAATKLLPSTSDDLANIKSTIALAAASSDVVIITGGVSVGKYDLTKQALLELGAKVYFDRVRLKPGKPAVFAKLGETLIFGLPGNPVSAAVTYYLFVRKALLIMQGAVETDLRKVRAVTTAALKAAKDRDTYLPAKFDIDSEARFCVTPVKWIGSSDFIGFAKCDVLAFVPGSGRIAPGEITDVVLL